MSRRRFGVVLLVPEPFATEIQGLRRAVGDPSIDRVAPHLTLVPPVNVGAESVSGALQLLREAAAQSPRPLVLDLGPPASFVPDSDTAFLSVSAGDGDERQLKALHDLRDRVLRAPLERTLEWPFVPHVTIGDGLGTHRTDQLLATLDKYRITVSFGRLHLLEEVRVEGKRRWLPVADFPFVAPTVVGRGGVELELSRTELLDPQALDLLNVARARDPIEHDDDEMLPPVDEVAVAGGKRLSAAGASIPRGASPVVVTARRRGELVAVGTGWHHPDMAGEITAVAVAFAHHGHGIARQIRLALEHDPT